MVGEPLSETIGEFAPFKGRGDRNNAFYRGIGLEEEPFSPVFARFVVDIERVDRFRGNTIPNVIAAL